MSCRYNRVFIKQFFLTFFLLCSNSSLLAQHQHHAGSTQTSVPSIAKKTVVKKQAALVMKSVSIPRGMDRTVNLVVSYKTVNFAGLRRKALAVNNQIPAPTLHFKKGDHVTINVYNHLNKETAIHWHGLLVPWQMDGVEGVSQKPIPPGGVFHYRFTLYQSGTYWYHAHLSAQEQEGLYGAFIIDPPHPPSYKYTKDYVLVLSDWSNTPAEKTFLNLKKAGDYYSSRFPLQPSLIKFIHDYRKSTPAERKNILNDYKMMQQMRMSIYDLSDVAYDAYLLNGQTTSHPWTTLVKVGDVVRLRFIGAAGSTIYNVKIPGTTMEMVHVQGNDIKPEKIKSFTIAPGETEDILVNIKKNKPYIIYAESIDTLGKAFGALITQPKQSVNYSQVAPFPEPLPVTREMMANMMKSEMDNGKLKNMPTLHSAHSAMSDSMKMDDGMQMNQGGTMDHSMNMSMPTEPTIVGDSISPANTNLLRVKTVGTKYQDLIAAVKTNDPHKSVDGIIRMELFGYMDHFMWFINGLPEYKSHPIIIEPGKRYRIIFTNNSMMRHPMHIHGHWFILRNGHGIYDPLLHTIEVPPGATAVADIDTDASGQWFFHCHHLYHMLAGMSHVFQYATLIDIVKGTAKPENFIGKQKYINRPIVREDDVMPIDASLVNHPMAHAAGLYFASLLDIGADPFHNVQKTTFKGLYGSDYNKLELFSDDAELNKGTVENADLDIFCWHLLSQFWAIKGGVNYYYRPGGTYVQPGIGIEGLMPYFIDTDVRTYYHDGSIKFDIELSRDTQITNNFFIRTGVRSISATKTVLINEIGSGLNQIRYTIRPYYRLMPALNIFTEFEHEQDYGVFKNIRRNGGESTSENTIAVGLSALF